MIKQILAELAEQFERKNAEYKGATADQFRNFNQGAALQSETPEQTLLGYVNKQIVNLFDAKHHNPERLTDRAFIDEKAGDVAVYMIILMAMVRSKEQTDILMPDPGVAYCSRCGRVRDLIDLLVHVDGFKCRDCCNN